MSGHSKWSTIKRKKGLKDAKRGALFTRLARDITMAASEGGGDISMNFSLRIAVDKAKQANMPKDNIERAIQKGTGDIKGESFQRVSYEAYGPAGSAFLVDCTTDNTNRTVADIKNIVESRGAKLASIGSVSWQFEEKGAIVILPQKIIESEKYGSSETLVNIDKDDLVLELIEINGIEDIRDSEIIEDGVCEIEIICQKTMLRAIHEELENRDLKVINSSLIKIAKEEIKIEEETKRRLEGIVEALYEYDDVDNVWLNVV